MFHHKNLRNSVLPSSIYEEVERKTIDKNGVERSSFVVQDCSVTATSIPSPEDYRLEDLMKAGVPLSPVPCDLIDNLDEVSASHIVSNLTDTDNNSND